MTFIVFFLMIATMLLSQQKYNKEDWYNLNIDSNIAYLNGNYGKISKDEPYIVTFHLLKDVNYIIKYQGDNTSFKFNNVVYLSISGKVDYISITPKRDFYIHISIVTSSKGSFNYVLLLNNKKE